METERKGPLASSSHLRNASSFRTSLTRIRNFDAMHACRDKATGRNRSRRTSSGAWRWGSLRHRLAQLAKVARLSFRTPPDSRIPPSGKQSGPSPEDDAGIDAAKSEALRDGVLYRHRPGIASNQIDSFRRSTGMDQVEQVWDPNAIAPSCRSHRFVPSRENAKATVDGSNGNSYLSPSFMASRPRRRNSAVS
jgi:hypothetical protein